MKLELKHLAPYLPYSLMFKHTIIDKTLEMIGVENQPNLRVRLIDGLYVCEQEILKPILRPMFDLVADKEICDLLNLELEPNGLFLNGWYLLQNSLNAVAISYEEMQNVLTILYSKHYDVFGLIPVGLAISIHDVEQVIA